VSNKKGRKGKAGRVLAAEDNIDFASLSPAKLAKELKRLEEKMFQHAKDLEFEEAAGMRDVINKAKAVAFVS
jgi:excinuclease ABC subunit B